MTKKDPSENRIKKNPRSVWRSIVTVLAAIAVFTTTYALIIPAITWERTLICEVEEHTHTAECYADGDMSSGTLICDKEEHKHTDLCFDALPDYGLNYSCGLDEHTHNEDCYRADGTLGCTIPEHEHGSECIVLNTVYKKAHLAGEGDDDLQYPVLVVAGSDFQEPTTSATNWGRVHNYVKQNQIIDPIMQNISDYYDRDAYGFFAGGDYGFESSLGTTDTENGIKNLKQQINTYLGLNDEQRMVIVQGNHDNSSSVYSSTKPNGWDPTGSYDTPYYGVYEWSEDDFPAKTGSGSSTNTIAANLETYLQGRAANHPDQPVFILTHVPLHFNTRTAKEGDSRYGKRIYDILVKYGRPFTEEIRDKNGNVVDTIDHTDAAGLNIIFLYGHNHAWGDDDYMGGSANYVSDISDPSCPNDNRINIADDGSQSSYKSYNVNFTYTNYGYTGYYWSKWVTSGTPQPGNADSTLTMTSFLIYDDRVEIARWDASGMHDLKSVGAASAGLRPQAEVCTPTSTRIQSSQTLHLYSNTPDPYSLQTRTYSGVSVTAMATEDWDVSISKASSNSVVEAYKSGHADEIGEYTVYTINQIHEGVKSGENLTIRFPTEDKYTSVKFVDGDTLSSTGITVSDETTGYLVVTTPHLSDWTLYAPPAPPEDGEDPNGPQTLTNNGVTVVTDNGTVLTVTKNSAISTATQNGVTNPSTYTITTFDGTGNAAVSLPIASNQDAVWKVNGNSIVKVPVTISDGVATFNDSNISGATYIVGKEPTGQTVQSTEHYWVKCTRTDDLNGTDKFMVTSGNNAFGVTTNGSATSGSISIAEVTIGGTKYYTITGNGSTNYFQWHLDSKMQNIGNSSRYLRLNNKTIISNEDNASINTYSRTGSGTNITFRISAESGNDTYYLKYKGSSFSQDKSKDKATDFTIYKDVAVNVTKYKPTLKVVNTCNDASATPAQDIHTTIAYQLRTSSETNYERSTPVTGISYKVYNSDGSLASSRTLDLDGKFTLEKGQYAVFADGLDTENNYFISEPKSEAISSANVKIDGGNSKVASSTTADYYTNIGKLSLSLSSNNVKTVEFINSVEYVETKLEINFNIIGRDGRVPSNAGYNITVLDSNGRPAVFETMDLYSSTETITEGAAYNPKDPVRLFGVRNGYKVVLHGLPEGSYTVTQDLDGYTEYFVKVETDVNGVHNTITDDIQSTTTVNANEGSTVTFTNTLAGRFEITFDYGNGTTVTRYTDSDGHVVGTIPTDEGVTDGYIFRDWHTAPNQGGIFLKYDPDNNINQFNEHTFTSNTTLYAHSEKLDGNFRREPVLTKKLDEDTAYSTGKENIFDIGLTADLPSSSSMGLVLTFDLSSSMENFCAVCGDDYHTTSKTSNTSGTGWSGSRVQETFPAHVGVKRIDIMKRAAQEFLVRLYEHNAATGVEHCYIQVVGFWQNVNRYITNSDGYIDLVTEEALIQLVGDYSVKADGSPNNIKDGIIGTLPESGVSGTNLAGGMKFSYESMQTIIGTGDIPASNTYVVLLSDGAPNTNDTTLKSNYDNASSQYYIDDRAMDENFIAKWKEIWSYKPGFDWHDTGFSTSASGAKQFHMKATIGVPYYAEQIHDIGSHLYTVVLGHNRDYNTWQSANNYARVPAVGLDAGDFLSTFSDLSLRADKIEDNGVDAETQILGLLDDFYNQVIGTTEVNTRNAVVTDPMSEEVEFIGFLDSNGTLISGNTNGKTAGSAGYAVYDPDTRMITWYPTDVEGNLDYRVRLKNEAAGFKDWDETAKSYYTNGTTELTYDISFGSDVFESGSKFAELPYVHGWLGELSFIKVGGLINDVTATPVPNIQFTLHHDPSTCSECIKLSADKRAQISDIVSVSGADGVVFFDIPSGHEYIMTEAPNQRYITNGATYTVTVTQGVSTVSEINKPSGAQNYWTPSNGTTMNRLFNLYNGEPELPATGGSGTVLISAAGFLLIAGGLTCGWFGKRKCERRKK